MPNHYHIPHNHAAPVSQIGQLPAAYTGTYDAWNRLVRIEDGSNKVAEYEYDGAKRRALKKTYVSGILDETRHFYYTEPSKWQVVEERVESSSDAERQFVWGLRYVDDLVLRDRDTDDDAALDKRLYGMQDANWNVTSICNTVGSDQERYSYDAYGTSIALTPSFAYRGASSFAWEVRYAGYRFDSDSGLFYVRNRIYHPALSWLQRDPLGYSDNSWNLYQYVNSAPLSELDPHGTGLPLWLLLLIFTCAAFCIGCAVNLFSPAGKPTIGRGICIGIACAGCAVCLAAGCAAAPVVCVVVIVVGVIVIIVASELTK